ncbi:hypothetical protein BLOT_005529, partial [Blomia tropicalis]
VLAIFKDLNVKRSLYYLVFGESLLNDESVDNVSYCDVWCGKVHVEPILLLVMAYSSYVSAEIFEWSGVVSIIGCGL